MGRSAFVTGGTGFIGINLIELLVNRGWQVTALHRPSSDLSRIRRFPVRLKAGSVTDYSSLAETLPDDVHAVFHLAGDTSLWKKNNARQKKINVLGAANMMKAAAAKNIPVFIHTSSTSAWGTMSGKRMEESVPQAGKESRVNYERTKWEGEQEVLRLAPARMKVVILNPAAVTGPYDMNNWGRLFFALRDGKLPGLPRGIISVNHVREVAGAHLSAVDNGRDRERYILAGEDCRISDFVTEMARISGISKVPRSIPTPVFRLLAALSSAASAVRGTKPELTPELVKLLTRTRLSFSSRKAADQLGYRIIPMKESVRDCYCWLKSEHYI